MSSHMPSSAPRLVRTQVQQRPKAPPADQPATCLAPTPDVVSLGPVAGRVGLAVRRAVDELRRDIQQLHLRARRSAEEPAHRVAVLVVPALKPSGRVCRMPPPPPAGLREHRRGPLPALSSVVTWSVGAGSTPQQRVECRLDLPGWRALVPAVVVAPRRRESDVAAIRRSRPARAHRHVRHLA